MIEPLIDALIVANDRLTETYNKVMLIMAKKFGKKLVWNQPSIQGTGYLYGGRIWFDKR